MTIVRSISLTVDVSDAHVPLVLEVLARAAAGLLLEEGIDARIHSYQFDDADVDTD